MIAASAVVVGAVLLGMGVFYLEVYRRARKTEKGMLEAGLEEGVDPEELEWHTIELIGETEWEDARTLSYAFTPKKYDGSMYYVAQVITGAGEFWNDGYTGQGIDVALIDTGVVPVNGLTYKNKVVNGPDLSFESQDPDLRYLDTFGHGTHLAGIIAGRINKQQEQAG